MDFFYTKIENSGPATARIGIKGHAPLSQFLNSSFILQFRLNIYTCLLVHNIHCTTGDGIPLALSLFPGNQNEQKSLKSLETKFLQQFGCDKFIYCSGAELASED